MMASMAARALAGSSLWTMLSLATKRATELLSVDPDVEYDPVRRMAFCFDICCCSDEAPASLLLLFLVADLVDGLRMP
jgi:hypothetical protein